MVSENLSMGIKIVIPVKYCYLVVMSKERESLYTRVISWLNTIVNLDHFDTRAILPRYDISCIQMVNGKKCRPKWYKNKNTVKYPYPTGLKKCESFVLDT